MEKKNGYRTRQIEKKREVFQAARLLPCSLLFSLQTFFFHYFYNALDIFDSKIKFLA